MFLINHTGYSLGRIRGNEAYREALRRQNEETPSATPGLTSNSVYKPIYSLGPDMPKLELDQVSAYALITRGTDRVGQCVQLQPLIQIPNDWL